MRNITEDIIQKYKNITIINTHNSKNYKFKTKDTCFICIKSFNFEKENLYTFSWSEFTDGYFKRCKISKLSYKYSKILEKKIIKKNFIIFKLLNLFFDKKLIRICLKKYILTKVHDYLYILYAALELKTKDKKVIINNDLNDFSFFEKNLKFFNKKKIPIKDKNNLILMIFAYLYNIIMVSFYNVYTILFVKKINYSIKRIKYAIRYYNAGFNLNSTPKINWILNNQKKSNYFFICEDNLSNKKITQIKKLKYNFIQNSNSKPINQINIRFLHKYLFDIFICFFLSFFLFFKTVFLTEFIKYFIIYYFKWKKFFYVFKLSKYISYNNYDLEHIIRNYLIKKSGGISFHYKHTFAENLYEDKKFYNNYLYGYQCYDTEFHWNDQSISMSLSDNSISKNYISTGPIINQYLSQKQIGKKNIISFFTTQLGTKDSVCSIKNHISFLKFIKKMSINKKKLKFVLKTKYKQDRIKKDYPNVFKELNELKKLKNIKIVESSKYKNLLLESALIISMPFASTSIEGIFNNIPSYYLDIEKQFNNVFYKKIGIYFSNSNEIFKKIKNKNTNIPNIRKKIFQFKNYKINDVNYFITMKN
jgi:polysaccharide biosynthesis PFTS motif protein